MNGQALTRRLVEAGASLDAVLDLAADALASAVGDSGLIRLVGPDGIHLDTTTVHHPDPDVEIFLAEMLTASGQRADEGLSQIVRSTGRPFVRLDLAEDEAMALALPAHRPFLRRVGISSIMVLPLIVEGEYVGYVGCSRDRGSPAFTPQEVEFAEDLTARICLAVGQARATATARQRSREHVALARLGQAALGQGDPDELYTATALSVADALGGDWALVYEKVDDRLVLRADAGPVGGRASVGVEETDYVREVLASAEPVVVFDVTALPNHVRSPEFVGRGIHSGMSMAVRAQDEVLAVVGVHESTPRRYSADEKTFLAAAASTLAGGILRRRSEQDLAHRAHHDALTGLANRALLLELLGHALARGSRGTAMTGLVFIDLDGFKAINDRSGHGVGDAVLRAVAARLDASTRPGDVVARLGGDEFVVLCEDLADAEEALAVASRLRDRIAEPVRVGDEQLDLGASLGIAMTRGEIDAEQLLRDADAAMYRAKTVSGNSIEVFDERLQASVDDRRSLRRELAEALDTEAFTVEHQPVVDLRTSRVSGTEVLARWTDPRRGAVAPSRFVGAAEGSALIDRLGMRVLEIACRDAMSPVVREAGWRVSVNVSPQQLLDTGAFVGGLGRVLEETGVDASRVCLEVTEAVTVTPRARQSMVQAALLGVSWALDDFGTGHASLAAAFTLPLQQIKLDRSLISGLAAQGRVEALAGVVAFARGCGYECVAEGVETQAELEVVVEAGCTHVQGYLLGRPVPVQGLARVASDVGALLAAAGDVSAGAPGAARPTAPLPRP